MKIMLRFVLAILTAATSAQAAEFPCALVKDEILGNVTNNRGCGDPNYSQLCKSFSRCLRQNNICLIHNNRVVAGQTYQDIKLKERKITFGADQTFQKGGSRYCVVAGIGITEGPGGYWIYSVFSSNGDSVHPEAVDEEFLETVPMKNPSEFSKKARQAFKAALPKYTKQSGK